MGFARIGFAGALASVLLTTAGPAAAAMTADEFLTRGLALKKKGMMAIFQKKEINLLVEEMKGATTAYKADYDKAQPAGDPALGCPPRAKDKNGKPTGTKLNADELLDGFAAIPKDQRQRMSVKAAFYDFMRRRYPCS